MKRDVAEILPSVRPDKLDLQEMPAIQRLARMREWMEHRLWRRARVRIPVALAFGDENCIAVVTDISAHGLGLSGVNNLAADTVVTVAMHGFAPLSGKVVWVKGKRAGVQLDRSLLG